MRPHTKTVATGMREMQAAHQPFQSGGGQYGGASDACRGAGARREIRAFGLELARLKMAQVVSWSDEQHRHIEEYHRSVLAELSQQFDIDRDMRSKQLSLAMRVASLLGAIALAASVFFLFHQFWGRWGTGHR